MVLDRLPRGIREAHSGFIEGTAPRFTKAVFKAFARALSDAVRFDDRGERGRGLGG